MSELLSAIKREIEQCGQTRYRIAKATGISESQLSRLMSGECGLSFDALERLSAYLGLEIIIRPKKQQKKGK